MLSTIAHFLAGNFIAMFMLSVGLRTDRSALRAVSSRRGLLLRTLAIVWIAVPLVALALILILRPSQMGSIALMAMAICPGVPLVLRKAKKAHGDATVSLLVLGETALTAIVMIPLWAVILKRFTPLDMDLSARDIVVVLAPAILLPFFVGRGINALAPRIAPTLAKIATALFVAGLVLLVIAAVPKIGPAFQVLGVRDYVAALLLSIVSAAVGYAGIAPPLEQRVSVSYAAALGNPMLALTALAHVEGGQDVKAVIPVLLVFLIIRGLALVPVKLWFDHERKAMPPRTLATAILIALVAIAAGACSTNSTSLEQQWLAPTARVGELHNVVVLAPSSNEAVRRIAEEKLAQKIAARGPRAVPGYSVLRTRDLEDREHMAAALRRAGFDGVVVMRFVDREQKLAFDPYYDAYWGDAWVATIPETIVRVEINAYALDGNGLVWSGMSRSVDPDGIGDLIEEVTEVASRELDEQRLLSKRREI